MESVEVWMWTIAGLVIGIIVLTSAYVLLSKYTHNVEVNAVVENFQLVKASAENVCRGGRNAMETKVYTFPYIVNNITTKNSSNQVGEGRTFCITIKDEGEICEEFSLCNATMPVLDLTRKDSLFYLIQKAVGRGKKATVEFKVQKVGIQDVDIAWKHVYAD
ncbi:hypothetical protein JW968_05140 [Candidatus Woesearchaeota archaeon]|nr:hypothetical protein [Candidatus Woesearchaeota archaeon]